jgi:hypothetical protein
MSVYVDLTLAIPFKARHHFRFYGIAFMLPHVLLVQAPQKYAMVTGEIKVAKAVSSGIRVTKAIAKLFSEFWKLKRK